MTEYFHSRVEKMIAIGTTIFILVLLLLAYVVYYEKMSGNNARREMTYFPVAYALVGYLNICGTNTSRLLAYIKKELDY